MKNTDCINKSIIKQYGYSNANTYVNKQNAMDYEVQTKTERQESDEYLHQFCRETSQNYGLNSDENMSKISSYRHHQSQNNGVNLSNPMPSPNLKQCTKCDYFCESMYQILEHIHNCHQTTTALCNVINDHNYSMMPECEIIKLETEILDSYEVQDLDKEENIQHQCKQITHQSNQYNENENHPIFIPNEKNENLDGNPTINEETDIIETKRSAIIAPANSTATNGDILISNNTPVVGEIMKTETEILDLNSYEVQVLGVEENIIHFKTNQIVPKSNQHIANGNHPMFNTSEKTDKYSMSNQIFNEDLSSAKSIWKSNDVRKSNINNCSTCNKSFVTWGSLRKHYKSKLHRYVVKRSGLPDPAILSINNHNHPDATFKERIIQLNPKKIIHKSNQAIENDNHPMFNTSEERQELDKYSMSNQRINEHLSSPKSILKSNDVIKSNINNCTTCNKSFVTWGSLRKHYKSKMHKHCVKRSALPKPAILPINSHHNPNATYKERIIQLNPKEIIYKSNQPIENDNHPMFNTSEERQELDKYSMSNKRINEHLSSPKTILKSNDGIKSNINNCTTCNKSFTTCGSLRKHYKSKLHKHSLKRNALPKPAILPIKSHHHPNATYKETSIQFNPKQIIHQSNLRNENDNCHIFTPNEEREESNGNPTSNQDMNIPDHPEMLTVNDITTIYGKTDIIETKRSEMIAPPHSTPTDNVFSSSQLTSNNTPDVDEENQNQHGNLNSNQRFRANEVIESTSYNCTICRKTFTTYCNLKNHYKTNFHKKVVKSGGLPVPAILAIKVGNVYKCDQCPEEFTLQHIFFKHMYDHTGKKPFSCNVCETSFLTRNSLNGHKTIHTGEKPFKCDQCPKRFRQKSNLKLHKFVHTGKKPFSCDECGKTFRKKEHLKDHALNHSSEKPHKCDQCSKEFRRKQTLKYHMGSHLLNHAQKTQTNVINVRNNSPENPVLKTI